MSDYCSKHISQSTFLLEEDKTMAWIRSMLLVASVVLNAAGQTTEAEVNSCFYIFLHLKYQGTKNHI